MALQGNIETFALQDVLRLLASTKKTGCLRLDGSRGTGTLLVENGQLVGGDASLAPHAEGPTDVLFEMLRFDEGDFVFDADAEVAGSSAAEEVEAALEAAEAQLEEWKGIVAVVPSLDHWVGLAPELPGDDITVTKDQWRTLVAIAGGTSVGRLGDILEQGELPVSRTVKALAELGLVELDEPRDEIPAAPAAVEPEPEPEPEEEPEAEPAFESFDATASFVVGSEEEAEEGYEPFDPDALVIEESAPEEPAEADDAPLDQADAAMISRQLANLSPKAARAVAAAAKATTMEEREALLAEVDDEDEPINRELLLKFLGSVSG